MNAPTHIKAEPQDKSAPKSAKPAKAAKGPTPMMVQYLQIKEKAGEDVILFYRMGDFYEMFFDDAIKAAAALDIALTKRGKHKDEAIPMCGVPVHAAQNYLQKLIRCGFRVAVCEQMESPAEAKKRGYKAIVQRDIVRIVTPGTLSEDALLDAKQQNLILAIGQSKAGDLALAWADISVGSFEVLSVQNELNDLDPIGMLATELHALRPREIIVSDALYDHENFKPLLMETGAALTPLPSQNFDHKSAERAMKQRYAVEALDGFGSFTRAEISACGALLSYLSLTQAGGQSELSPPKRHGGAGFMSIDPATRASLEIDKSLSTSNSGRQGSLLHAIDNTVTGPGARCLAERLSRPLLDIPTIEKRLDVIDWMVENSDIRSDVRAALKKTGDPARALSRLLLGRGGPRDLLSIATSLRAGTGLNDLFSIHTPQTLPDDLSAALAALNLSAQGELAGLIGNIETAIEPDAPLLARDGGFIAKGWRPDLDALLSLRDNSRGLVAQLQGQYAQTTGVSSLKVKHNNVLGYFIEVTPKHGDILLSEPHKDQFIHRQTLVSGVRFTTSELVDLDTQISGAAEKATALELEIFAHFLAKLQDVSEPIRAAATALAELDVSSALAHYAQNNFWVRPLVDDSLEFHIEGGRHPVVEDALKKEGGVFSGNHCHLNADQSRTPAEQNVNQLTLITGPNMAGKSTYLRQNALMFILAQSGCFVPARRAHIGIADALFSRVGASDDLSRGRSTFMSEMIETAAILNQAGPRTFVILDEIGRGTATYDGLSIAWAATEHLYEVNQCRALFATHYHELTDMVEALPFGGNACLHAKEWEGELVFMHEVRKGAADKSYGVHVARLAGLPPLAIARAEDVLSRLENPDTVSDAGKTGQAALDSLPLFSAQTYPSAQTKTAAPSKIDAVIADLDVDGLSARDALDLLYELKEISGDAS